MTKLAPGFIRVRTASEHNLKNVSLDIPHHQLIVVTGVSGSGKSSLAFDVIAKEGQRRYLETFSSFSRQFMGKMSRPEVESIEGLSPVITIGQKTVGSSVRSTVGTMSDLYDLLRLLFARLGKHNGEVELSRSLFSFNSPKGACPTCKGLGVEEKIALDKLITGPHLSLREGALAPTLPNGYIMYSQVTIDVLNQVCEAHGFNVEIPWNELTPEQQNIVLNGSNKIKVPFGKHSLESRLKWTGITAKPREEGHYKGMLPIMTDILKRDRNANILKYVASITCSECDGKRLNKNARNVTVNGHRIQELSALELLDLKNTLNDFSWEANEREIGISIVEKMVTQIDLLEKLGVGYLTLDRPAAQLSGGESQRIRLVNQVGSALSDVLYVFDEPSIGLHPHNNQAMLDIFDVLVQNGNTVIVVEHDAATILHADWIVDIGPNAGIHGGQVLFNGTLSDFLSTPSLFEKSPTYTALMSSTKELFLPPSNAVGNALIKLEGCCLHNLKHIDASFVVGGFNVITGVSGAGKSSLMHGTLQKAVEAHLEGKSVDQLPLQKISGHEHIDQLINITQSPIGRTPRSNPATYTGMADKIRDIFGNLSESKAVGYTKSRFSFNNKGGRCETCQGAGQLQIGMHLLGNVSVICGDCNGKRFNEETLSISYKGKNIFEVFELSIDEAFVFFEEHKTILKQLTTLKEIGLGYLTLGQASTTLSGGEAQRIKLATQLQKKDTGNTLYLLDEPTTGLHISDVNVLIKALKNLTKKGNTVVCIEHEAHLIRQADHVLDIGPNAGKRGGKIVVQGTPLQISKHPESKTGKALLLTTNKSPKKRVKSASIDYISLKGITTHQLKNIDVNFPKNKLTVVTGVSGSGKSSLVFETLFAEAQSRFSESLSTYSRSLLKQSNQAEIESCEGLGPVIAIHRKYLQASNRSTVGTITGLNEHYRLLYSRISHQNNLDYSARHFSFNHQLGACPACDGLGLALTCDPDKLLSNKTISIAEGAMNGSKPGKFYGDPHGQYLAILQVAAEKHGFNVHQPWNSLSEKTRDFILYGTGETSYNVTWEFKNKTRSGVQQITAPWLGFCNYIDEEFQRKRENKNTDALKNLLREKTCNTCGGTRLKKELEAIKCQGISISELSKQTIQQNLSFFETPSATLSPTEKAILEEIGRAILPLLRALIDLGLSYLAPARSSIGLSGGEQQRLRLAGQLSSKLYGVTYVLDEPTVGLHPNDTQALLKILRKLVANGNTAIVVEHDETVIKAADHLIEMGPGAGHLGGNILTEGTANDLIKHPKSITGKYLKQAPNVRSTPRELKTNSFGIRKANLHNLKNIDVDFISGGITAVTGVSGSGKSTLINKVLYASAKNGRPVGCTSVYGLEQFDRIVLADQKPLSSNALSTPATYSGIMELLRNEFAKTDLAKKKNLKKSAFSYIHKDGKCLQCNGHGQTLTSMDFMRDVWTVCDTCKGARYKKEVLEITYKQHTIADFLQMTIAEAAALFKDHAKISAHFSPLLEVGIGHLKLGQPGNTLSGGESQRLKLATELLHHRQGNHLYLFDEPTTGLHFQDIEQLSVLFNALISKGNTIIFIEHNKQLIDIANQILTVGPFSGPDGGQIEV